MLSAVLVARPKGWMRLWRPLDTRRLHDALLEDLLDRDDR